MTPADLEKLIDEIIDLAYEKGDHSTDCTMAEWKRICADCNAQIAERKAKILQAFKEK